MAERCAVIGVGQTVAKSKREDVSIAGLVREAALAALEDAGLDVRRHRRRGGRQGARHVRGRHDARAVPGAGPRRGGEADVPGPHGRVGRGLDRHRGLAPRRRGHPRAGADRGLREAERLRRHVGALGAPALLGAAAGRGRRLLRPHHPGLHAPVGRARPHRHDGGGQGPAARAQEPLRPPPPARHLHEMVRGLDHAVGPAPLPRDLPVVRRRRRHGASGRRRRRRRPPAPPAAAGLDPRHGHALGADHVRRARPGEPAGRAGLRRRRVPPGRDHRTRGPDSTWPRCTCPSAGTSPCGSRTWASAPRATGGSSPRRGPRRWSRAGTSRGTARGACCRPTPSAPRGCCASSRRPCRCGARPASTRCADARRALGQAYGGGSQFFAMWVVGADKP